MASVAGWLIGACLALTDAPAIAIIVDDLGYRPAEDHAALTLPGPVAYGILPFTPHGRELAAAVHASGREVLLHLPMEAESDNHLLGPGALYVSMSRPAFGEAVQRALGELPHLVGVNNHMGSRLTRDEERMRWLMEELGLHGSLVYVDSRTTALTVARKAARVAQVPYLARDVFLDNQRDADYIHAQLDALVSRARERGYGIGIAHPHPETTAVLRQRLAALGDVHLVSLTQLRQPRCSDLPDERRADVDSAAFAETERRERRDDP